MVDPRQAAELAAKAGLRIYTIGVGSEHIAIDSLFGTQVVNPGADLDETTLAAIAEITGGSFFRARDAAALRAVYRRLDEIEPSARDEQVFRAKRSLYMWPLAAALALSLVLGLHDLAPLWQRVQAWRSPR